MYCAIAPNSFLSGGSKSNQVTLYEYYLDTEETEEELDRGCFCEWEEELACVWFWANVCYLPNG